MTASSRAARWILLFGFVAVVVTGAITSALDGPRWLAVAAVVPIVILTATSAVLEVRRAPRE